MSRSIGAFKAAKSSKARPVANNPTRTPTSLRFTLVRRSAPLILMNVSARLAHAPRTHSSWSLCNRALTCVQGHEGDADEVGG